MSIDFLIRISLLTTNAPDTCLYKKVLNNAIDLYELRILSIAAWALIAGRCQ